MIGYKCWLGSAEEIILWLLCCITMGKMISTMELEESFLIAASPEAEIAKSLAGHIGMLMGKRVY